MLDVGWPQQEWCCPRVDSKCLHGIGSEPDVQQLPWPNGFGRGLQSKQLMVEAHEIIAIRAETQIQIPVKIVVLGVNGLCTLSS